MRYTVAARVERNGVLMFINDTSYQVITQGAGDVTSIGPDFIAALRSREDGEE